MAKRLSDEELTVILFAHMAEFGPEQIFRSSWVDGEPEWMEKHLRCEPEMHPNTWLMRYYKLIRKAAEWRRDAGLPIPDLENWGKRITSDVRRIYAQKS